MSDEQSSIRLVTRATGSSADTVIARVFRRGRSLFAREPHVIVEWSLAVSSNPALATDESFALSIHRGQWHSRLANKLRAHLSRKQLSDRQALVENGGLIWLVEHDESIVGWGAASPAGSLKAWWWQIGRNDWVISRVRTFEAWKGRGAAPWALVQIVNECCAGGGRVYADMARSNSASRAAFRKAGAKEIGASTKLRKLWP